MKIEIKYEYLKDNNYINILFKELEKDKELERIIKGIRKKHNIIPSSKRLLLRSWILLASEEDVDKVIKAFPFLQDWRKGIKSLIIGGVFLLSSDSYSIKLRVRNNKNPYQGTVTEMPNEEGVKIVLTSKVREEDLYKWIKDNYLLLVYYLRKLPSLSLKTSTKKKFERDRLIVFLRSKKRMKWREIADYLQKLGHPIIYDDALQQAYKDFPYK